MFLCSREKPKIWSLSSGSCLVGTWLWDWRLVASHQRMKLMLSVAEQVERILGLDPWSHHWATESPFWSSSLLSSSIHTIYIYIYIYIWVKIWWVVFSNICKFRISLKTEYINSWLSSSPSLTHTCQQGSEWAWEYLGHLKHAIQILVLSTPLSHGH